jgi:hypothetical protein
VHGKREERTTSKQMALSDRGFKQAWHVATEQLVIPASAWERLLGRERLCCEYQFSAHNMRGPSTDLW